MSATDLHEHLESKLLGMNLIDLVGLVGLVNLKWGRRTHHGNDTEITWPYDPILKLIFANNPAFSYIVGLTTSTPYASSLGKAVATGTANTNALVACTTTGRSTHLHRTVSLNLHDFDESCLTLILLVNNSFCV